jgi:hypothetical protein
MKEEIFNELLKSIKQCGKKLKGKRKVTPEEKEFLKSYDNGEWKSTKDFEKKKKEYQQIAKNTAARNKSKKPN